VVGKLGGSARTYSVLRQGTTRYAWSADGTRAAFFVGNDSIFAYSVDDGEAQLLAVNPAPFPWIPHSLAWSPDGRLIAYVNGNHLWRNSTNLAPSSIWIVDANRGVPVPVTDEGRMNLSPEWLPDSRHLLFVSNRDGPRGIYVVEVGSEGPRGPPRSVLPSSDPHSISVSADGRKLAYAKFPWEQNIWSIRIPETGVASIRDAIPVTRGNHVVENHDLSPDGEWIVFESNIQGELDIADITGDAFDPDWSPDGTEIAFYSAQSEGTGRGGEIRVVSAGGGTPEQVTDWPASESRPDWSPDGLGITYLSQGPERTGPAYIWIISRDSVGGPWGEPVRLNEFCFGISFWGPGSTGLLCNDRRTRTWVRVSREGEVLSHYDSATVGLPSFSILRFSPDGSRIYGVGTDQDGSEGIWWIPTSGGRAAKVVAFDDPLLTSFGVHTVGPEHLYLTIAQYESDIWVMDLEW
jgi:Tol biopolymer transport system component